MRIIRCTVTCGLITVRAAGGTGGLPALGLTGPALRLAGGAGGLPARRARVLAAARLAGGAGRLVAIRTAGGVRKLTATGSTRVMVTAEVGLADVEEGIPRAVRPLGHRRQKRHSRRARTEAPTPDPQIQVELVQWLPLARDDEVDPCSAPDPDPARFKAPHRGLLRRDGLPVYQVLVPEFGVPVEVAGEIKPPPAGAITVTQQAREDNYALRRLLRIRPHPPDVVIHMGSTGLRLGTRITRTLRLAVSRTVLGI